jgi:hypothetical protein
LPAPPPQKPPLCSDHHAPPRPSVWIPPPNHLRPTFHGFQTQRRAPTVTLRHSLTCLTPCRNARCTATRTPTARSIAHFDTVRFTESQRPVRVGQGTGSAPPAPSQVSRRAGHISKAPHPSTGRPGINGKMGIPKGALLPSGIFPYDSRPMADATFGASFFLQRKKWFSFSLLMLLSLQFCQEGLRADRCLPKSVARRGENAGWSAGLGAGA